MYLLLREEKIKSDSSDLVTLFQKFPFKIQSILKVII